MPEADTGDTAVADPDQAAVEALPPGSALLVVRRGPNAGSRFLLDVDLVTAGRHPDSDIFLDDVTVSRRHAEFVRSVGGFAVKDVGSLNGTYVNRHRIDEVLLTGGDEVQIGKYRLVYLVRPASPGAQPVTAAVPARAYLSIGEVLARLRPEFPDVTISKIRFLESEGLVEPQRTSSGYRKFGHDEIERLRYVLAAQRDRYLPLRSSRSTSRRWTAAWSRRTARARRRGCR